jgi:hypothetical protein
MNAGGGGAVGGARLVEAYEELRRRHRCEGSGGAGHEVLKRQGLAAWIEAFGGCAPAAARQEPNDPAPWLCLGATVERAAAGAGDWGVPVRLYPELIRLVAGVALGWLAEGL